VTFTLLLLLLHSARFLCSTTDNLKYKSEFSLRLVSPTSIQIFLHSHTKLFSGNRQHITPGSAVHGASLIWASRCIWNPILIVGLRAGQSKTFQRLEGKTCGASLFLHDDSLRQVHWHFQQDGSSLPWQWSNRHEMPY
jgi:hypothetical protein